MNVKKVKIKSDKIISSFFKKWPLRKIKDVSLIFSQYKRFILLSTASLKLYIWKWFLLLEPRKINRKKQNQLLSLFFTQIREA